MCDNPNCGEIFSEAETGWSTAQQVQVLENEDGQRRTVSVAIDLCPDCAGNTKEVSRKLAEGRRKRRIERLELEAGVSGDAIEDALREAEKRSRD